MPLLEERSIEAYAVDILGWGFVETAGRIGSVSVEAKRSYLFAFWQQVLGSRPAIFVGSSLGAATIIDFVAAHTEACAATLLLDPQGFIDGAPPVPAAFAKGGVELLRSWPLRSLGQKIAYEDGPRCDTDDAIRVGRLHCSREGWADDAVSWLLGGGYSVSGQVSALRAAPCTILWGRQDRVLPPSEYVLKFATALPQATFRWVESCGHVPHLEQPTVVAEAIQAVVCGEELAGDGDISQLVAAAAASPLDRLNAFLDTPILDTGVRGGPLEPFKRFARLEPELASAAASVLALSFFAVLGALLAQLLAG